jgi:acyl carrier protein
MGDVVADVEAQVIGVVASILSTKKSGVVVTATSMMGDPPEWDSLAFVEVFVAVSAHFGLDVSDDDAISFLSIPEIVEFVSERI